MKIVLIALSAASVSAFAPNAFGVRRTCYFEWLDLTIPSCGETTSLNVDLDYGMKNSYVPATGGDGGQGQFGAQSPNDWRVAGTSPVGETSYAGAADGGEEPWFAEAISTVSLDLQKADETLKAFTKDAAAFKIEEFAAEKPYGFTSSDAAMEELVGKLGYSKFLEMSTKQLMKTWGTLHPDPAAAKEE
ncbi:hypothetical protein THAPSDRAFT_268304 [Thalassiosira pseudonana CCMP1335]|uniref:Uncharacterized protein n=2 Tax=Thalassiosira pseudonana TaxID=35128 RepID=B8BUW3_THAPS|nr:hypothetical protein THAPSDRAFT_268304 [Thalassiosira pseudonana CCMP1335]EED94829.1 hypothetical protein THAPSDRAFT_268304 [Thalassiosira pseudonana CCMP1335]